MHGNVRIWIEPFIFVPMSRDLGQSKQSRWRKKNIGFFSRDELHFQMILFVDSIKSLTPAACIWLK